MNVTVPKSTLTWYPDMHSNAQIYSDTLNNSDTLRTYQYNTKA
jgi:hypothetical protein